MANMERTKQEEIAITHEPIALPFIEGDVKAAMEAFQGFLHLPEPIRNRLWYPGDPHRRNTSAGYVHKNPGDAEGKIDSSQDNKHVFHFTPEVKHMAEMAWPGSPPEAMSAFLSMAEEIYQGVSRGLEAHLNNLDDMNPALVGVHFPKDGVRNNHLRFLAYKPSGSRILAAGHYDKSTMTVAVAESHGGLRMGAGPEDLEVYNRDPNEPVMFHGLGWLKMHQMLGMPTDRLPAWHDVIDIGERVDEDTVRWAVILFANPAHLDTSPSKIDTHIPLELQGLGSIALTDLLAA